MNRLLKILFSPALATFTLLAFSVAMAVATFIENDYGTETTRNIIYNAWWFELLMLLLCISFIGNIKKYKLYKKEKMPVFLFHIAFVIIIIGAGITRYTGTEGVMRIREGQRSNIIISDLNYLQLHFKKGNTTKLIEKQVHFTSLQNNVKTFTVNFEGNDYQIQSKKFIADAIPVLAVSETEGKPTIELVVSEGSGRKTLFLKEGEIEKIGSHQHLVTFNNPQDKAINLFYKNDSLFVKSPNRLDFFEMDTQKAGQLKADSLVGLQLKTLYRSGHVSMVPKRFEKHGKIEVQSSSETKKDNDPNLDDALLVNVNAQGENKDLMVLYRQGHLPLKEKLSFGETTMEVSYGSKPLITPFTIQLDDFQLERYPGSTSPSSYASEVTVLDDEYQLEYRIFMNNVLDYKGYRFFQASYDTDEKGTVLSVNQDRAGTWVTYLGYALMIIGMFWTLFGRQSRFVTVQNKLKKLHKKSLLLLGIGLFSLQGFSQEITESKLDSIVNIQQIDKYQAGLFGRLMVQDLDGRIKPINTLASEFLRKVTRKPYFKYKDIKLDANQAFLAMHIMPQYWQRIPVIKIDMQKGGEAYSTLTPTENGYVSFYDLLSNNDYILSTYVEEANAKKPAERNEFDKEMLKTDERFNILFNILQGNYLRIIPKRGDKNKTWFTYIHTFEDFPEEDKSFAKTIVPLYFSEVYQAQQTNDWVEAENKLAYLKKYQDVIAADIIPSSQKVEAELWYNELNLNFWLFQAYWTLGFILLVLALVRIFKKNKFLNGLWNFTTVLILLAFILNTGNILLRWYISGHAPWSNGYEMLLFVGWSLILFGFIYHKKSDFTLPLATLFTGTLLFVSYLDWLNPEITNLMPVLKSYWLKIHVATIVSSYAPLALSALLGLMALFLMIFKTKNNKSLINAKIKELSYINELAITIGLFLLSAGTFLGGVWANESWGRYWAWDPKETWALISMMIYAIVLHLRLIPGLKSKYTLNMISIFAFYSIIMTSFGVNYYLSGLHSYASGDPLPIPSFIYYITGFLVLVSIIAYLRNKRDV